MIRLIEIVPTQNIFTFASEDDEYAGRYIMPRYPPPPAKIVGADLHDAIKKYLLEYYLSHLEKVTKKQYIQAWSEFEGKKYTSIDEIIDEGIKVACDMDGNPGDTENGPILFMCYPEQDDVIISWKK